MDGDEESGGMAPDELSQVRDVVLKAHPDVVPELIAGGTVAELLASVEPARAAFARVSERVKPAAPPPAVPAGSAPPAVDPGSLPAHELIRRGVGERQRRSK